ncbi:DNA recombination protein RmuC [Alkalilimnicola sp. S0819]|nr:DNA recombination protein RmuC [Alkalilimnicola sp. S0819]MPQ16546.1 DNA recombination protein RmuC [Alkalilimnicola sp. S0819]
MVLAALLLAGVVLLLGLWLRASRAAAALGEQLRHRDEMLQAERDAAAEAREQSSARESELAELRTRHAVLEARADNEARRLNDERERLQALEGQLEQARAEARQSEQTRAELAEQLATLRSRRAADQEHYEARLKELDQHKAALKQEFENLANKIFEAKSETFSQRNRESLDALLKPFREQMGEFKQKVEHVHVESSKQQSAMQTELKQLQNLHQQMSREANELATALKGRAKMQGNWGEMVLENVLDRSGLRLGSDYKREVSITDEQGKRARPDAVVYLPQERHLIIDAKVSLNAYTRFVNAEDELERRQALKEHVEAMGARIRELADRDYHKLDGLKSPDMVFMFVPIESAFVEALKADETLFQKAVENNVLVATPTTLLTSLNIVRQLWRFEDQNKHSAELAKKAERVYKKLKTFLGSFEDVKKGLDRAQDAYSKAERQLVAGPGNLIKQANEFRELAPAIRDQLPQYFTEKAELELDYDAEAGEEYALEAPALPREEAAGDTAGAVGEESAVDADSAEEQASG